MASSRAASLLILGVVLCCACFESRVAARSLTNAEKNEFLAAFNAERDKYGLPHFTWSSSVAAVSESFVTTCQPTVNANRGNLGENTFASAGQTVTPTLVADSWLGEAASWTCTSNTCATGGKCGLYTQLVWEDSTAIGCALEDCSVNSPFNGITDWTVVDCSFSPPGNYIGQAPFDVAQCACYPTCAAAPPPPPPPPPGTISPAVFQTTIVNAHNSARGGFGVGSVTWSASLAASAQQWADSCTNANSGTAGVGENLLASSNPAGVLPNPTDVMNGWIAEGANWDCAANTCTGSQCGLFTQMVWAGTTQVGCAQAQCQGNSPFGDDTNGGYWDVSVCHYSPAGNVVGQRPFPAGQCSSTPPPTQAPSPPPPGSPPPPPPLAPGRVLATMRINQKPEFYNEDAFKQAIASITGIDAGDVTVNAALNVEETIVVEFSLPEEAADILYDTVKDNDPVLEDANLDVLSLNVANKETIDNTTVPTDATTGGLSGGGIAGIIIASVALVAIIVVGAFFGYKYYQGHKTDHSRYG